MSRIACLALVCCLAASAKAQRREGDTAAPLEVTLVSAARFGDIAVPAGRYRLSLGVSDGTVALAVPESMVLVATVPVVRTPAAEPARAPRAYVKRLGEGLELVVLSQDSVFTARGEKLEGKSENSPVVQLAGKRETQVSGVEPLPADEQATLEAAVGRLLPSLLQCGDQAHRQRWSTDDTRFQTCVCPLVDKWRLPKLSRDIRLHRVLAKGKNGVSISAGVDGRARQCRVWTGPRSPEEPAKENEAPAAVGR